MFERRITFRLTQEHVKLAREITWRWFGNSYLGYLEMDAKRPYGNSDIEGDIAKILGWPIPETGMTAVQEQIAQKLHQSMQHAIPIMLRCGQEPGIYSYEEGQWTCLKKQS